MARGSSSRRKKPPPVADRKSILTPLISVLTGAKYSFNPAVADKQSFLTCSPVDGTEDPPPGTADFLKSRAQSFATVHDVIASHDYDYYLMVLTLTKKDTDTLTEFTDFGLLPIPGSKSVLQVEIVDIYEILKEVLSGKDLDRLHAMELEEVDDCFPPSPSSDEETYPPRPRKKPALSQDLPSKPGPVDSPRSALSTTTDNAATVANLPDKGAPLLQLPCTSSSTTAPVPDSLTTVPAPANLPPDSADTATTMDSNPDSQTTKPTTDPAPALLTKNPVPTTKTPAQRRARVRFMAVDFSKLDVVVPAPAPRVTVLFRPVSSTDKLDMLHPLKLNRELQAIGGEIQAVRTIRDGGLAIDFLPDADSAKLTAVTSLLGTPVTARLPAAPSSCAGVLHGIHLEFTDQEIQEELRTEPPVSILEVKRMAKPGQQSRTIKVVFNGTQLPEKAFLAGRLFRIRQYEARPLQCFKCGRYGHAARVCRSQLRCWTCSSDHETASCPNKAAPLCSSCGGSHPADFPACPARAFQLKVGEVKATHNLTFKAARSAVTKAAKETRSYASVTKGSTRPTTTTPISQPGFKPNTAHPRPPEAPADAASLARLFHGLVAILTTATATSDFAGALSKMTKLFEELLPNLNPYLFQLAA